METTFNKIPDKAQELLYQLKSHLHTKLYFFGSIQRYDYFPLYSDIDIDIFSENLNNTINSLTQFFNIDERKLKKVSWKLNGKIINGYKFTHVLILDQHTQHKIRIEFSIYHSNDKLCILKEHQRKMSLPFHILFLLFILKFCYYYLSLFSLETYSRYKKYILNTLNSPVDNTNNNFITESLYSK